MIITSQPGNLNKDFGVRRQKAGCQEGWWLKPRQDCSPQLPEESGMPEARSKRVGEPLALSGDGSRPSRVGGEGRTALY